MCMEGFLLSASRFISLQSIVIEKWICFSSLFLAVVNKTHHGVGNFSLLVLSFCYCLSFLTMFSTLISSQ